MATPHLATSRTVILSLYRNLLKTGARFSQYGFREYARRRTRDAFRQHQHETAPERIEQLVGRGLDDLEMLKRQTTIGRLYNVDRLVVEVIEPSYCDADIDSVLVAVVTKFAVHWIGCIWRTLNIESLCNSEGVAKHQWARIDFGRLS
jgi:hypothetical protein